MSHRPTLIEAGNMAQNQRLLATNGAMQTSGCVLTQFVWSGCLQNCWFSREPSDDVTYHIY